MNTHKLFVNRNISTVAQTKLDDSLLIKNASYVNIEAFGKQLENKFTENIEAISSMRINNFDYREIDLEEETNYRVDYSIEVSIDVLKCIAEFPEDYMELDNLDKFITTILQRINMQVVKSVAENNGSTYIAENS